MKQKKKLSSVKPLKKKQHIEVDDKKK